MRFRFRVIASLSCDERLSVSMQPPCTLRLDTSLECVTGGNALWCEQRAVAVPTNLHSPVFSSSTTASVLYEKVAPPQWEPRMLT